MDFGAKADGKTIDSPAINRAIESNAHGGGTVYLPAGRICVLFHPVKSNIHIYLEQGTRIIAAFPGKEEGYDTAEPNEHNKYRGFRSQPLEKLFNLGNRTGEYYDQWSRLNLWQRLDP